jgi:uncharacterized repeat protein (TIGR01451 family)
MQFSKRLAILVATLVLALAVPAGAQAPSPLPHQVTPWQPLPPQAAGPPISITSIPLNGASWTAIGPGPLSISGLGGDPNSNVSGRLVGIAPHPTDPNTIYIAAAGGGVWKTTNATAGTGLTWTPLTDTQRTVSMGAIAIAPSNPLVLYAGTGEANNSGDSNFGRGILVSTDGGATWTLTTATGAFDRLTTSAIAVDPTNPNIAYAAMADFGVNGLCCNNTGIWKTTNGGTTWTNTTAPTLTQRAPYSDVKVDPNNASTVYMAIGNPFSGTIDQFANGVYKSTNGGGTWTLLTNAPNGTTSGRLAIGIGTSDSQVLYVSSSNPNTFAVQSVMRSTNGGATFTNVTPPNYMGAQGWYDTTIIVDPSNPAIVYVAGAAGANSILRSINSGGNWTDIHIGGAPTNTSPHVDHHGIAFDANGRLLDGDDGGIYRLDVAAPPGWTDLNGNLQTIQFQGIDLHPTDPNQAIGGSQDNGTELFGGFLVWRETDGGDGGFAKYSRTNPSRVYHQIPVASFGSNFFRRSDDGGNTWITKTSTIIADQSVQNFYAPFVVDPGNGDRVLYGTNRVWETTNGGDSWAPLSVAPLSPTNFVDAIGLAPSDTNTIYAATSSNHLFVTTNHGGLWTDHPIGVSGVIADIQVDPTTPATAYAVLSSFTTGGNVFRTINGGTNWNNISGNLPNEPVWSLQLDKANNILYVGADDGVYKSSDGGATWTRFGTGFPNAQVFQVVLNSTLHILGAATHGRGAFEILTTTAVAPPTISKTFGAATILVGATTSLTFTITNPNNSDLHGVAFSDTLPAGLTVASAPASACGGTLTAAVGGNSISLAGATIVAGTPCIFSVTVTGATLGVKNNVTGAITSTESGPGAASNTATLTVIGPPVISKTFAPASIPVGGTTVLTFTILNPNPTVALAGVAFNDTLPIGIAVASPNGLIGSCGAGTITTGTVAGFSIVTLSGGTIAAGGSCTFSVNVNGSAAGTQNNITSAVSSSNAGSGLPASASVTVLAPPVLTKTFGAAFLTLGASTSLTFSVTNPNVGFAVSGIGFTDVLPPGLLVSTPNGLTGSCGGGAITVVSGSNIIVLGGATLAAGASCSFSVNVTATVVGTQPNVTTPIASGNAGIGLAASATVVVTELPVINPFQVLYASNLSIGDSVINITNAGTQNVAAALTNICANVYAFSPDEQLISCCSCSITPNALVSLSVNSDLVSNTLTPANPTSVVVKLIATAGTACNPSNVATNSLAAGMRAWGTKLHALPGTPAAFGVTETSSSPAALSAAELARITSFCGFIQANGSGFGICKSCRLGGLGAVSR